MVAFSSILRLFALIRPYWHIVCFSSLFSCFVFFFPVLPIFSPPSYDAMMDLQETQRLVVEYLHVLADQFQRVPGSAIFLRYVKSSYQDDPVRSAVELFLFLFAVRYLLAPKYSTKPNFVPLSEEVCDPPSFLSLPSQLLFEEERGANFIGAGC